MEEELYNQLQKAGSISEYPSLSFGVAIKKTVGEQTKRLSYKHHIKRLCSFCGNKKEGTRILTFFLLTSTKSTVEKEDI